jgi:hypothetical protein
MEKRIFVAFGDGKAKAFRTKRGFLKWAVTTREGWECLRTRLFWWSFRLVVRVIIAVQQFMRNEKPFEKNCPVMVETADGIPAPCMFYMADGKTCPRHGDVSDLQKIDPLAIAKLRADFDSMREEAKQKWGSRR